MFERIRSNFQCVKHRARIHMFRIPMTPDILCLQWKDKNSSVCKNRARIPMINKIRQKFKSLEGKGENSNVYKKGQNSNVYIDSTRIPTFGRRSSEFPCLKG